jgi:hypothetical protein
MRVKSQPYGQESDKVVTEAVSDEQRDHPDQDGEHEGLVERQRLSPPRVEH